MVSLSDVQSSNSRIASSLPPGLVAVFVGATNGIGEATLQQFVKHARQPRVYFVGRSQEAGDRIAAECKTLNPAGGYTFINADVSLIRVVDEVCRDIKSKEKSINLLFLSQGTLVPGVETLEGLHYAAALVVHSRNRFIVNLLPLLQNATALRRVVSVFAATKEGPINMTDFQGWKVPLMSQRGHASSIVTLSLEALAKKAPTVAFVHDFPGPVKSGIARGTKGALFFVIKAVFTVIGPMVNMPTVESGERHVYLATSARYPAGANGDAASGVPLADGIAVARGTSSKTGSGIYSVDAQGETAGPMVEEFLAKMRNVGMVDQVWAHVEDDFERITGLKAA
ncbi:hypothetical protein B0A49_13632 [Cryomyces minteri]|uniref:Uncharacterized protein n=1 Tax=Cryomyces minteri TaxID=331657 RepID=A0A4U0WMZ8_9PEZI|nr:hypothetical protein B0A49_13632 [Cryomyces minteri]